MIKRFLLIAALVLGFGAVAQAQEFNAAKFNTWVDGTGPTSVFLRYLDNSQSDTTDMQSFEALLDGDTLCEMIWYVTADTAQAACWVDYYVGTHLIGSSTLDSLVYGFNTDKTVNTATINVWTSRPPGATHFRGRVTQSATYNMDGNEGRIGSATVTRD